MFWTSILDSYRKLVSKSDFLVHNHETFALKRYQYRCWHLSPLYRVFFVVSPNSVGTREVLISFLLIKLASQDFSLSARSPRL